MKREDLRIEYPIDYRGNSPRTATRSVTDEELAQLGYVKKTELANQAIKIAEALGYVRLFEDCGTCGGRGYVQYMGPSDNTDIYELECDDCVDGKVLREGVRESRQVGTNKVMAYLLDASLVEGER